jgi:hypothetical protein
MQKSDFGYRGKFKSVEAIKQGAMLEMGLLFYRKSL